MTIFNWFRRQSNQVSSAVSSTAGECTGFHIPPAGIWIRAKFGRSAPCQVAIAFTYDDPQTGRSAKGGDKQQGMQTEITIRFPGGCDSWKAFTPIEVEAELMLPAKPEWIRVMEQVPVEQGTSSGGLPTAFDLAVDRYLAQLRTSRVQCQDLNERGVALWSKQDLKGAMVLFQRARSVAEQADDRYSLANSIGNEALIVSASDPSSAFKIFLRQEAIWRELGSRLKPNLALALRNEIECLLGIGDITTVNGKLKEVEALAQYLRDKDLIEWTLSKKLFLSKQVTNPNRPWRNDLYLRGQFSDKYPDDLVVEFREPGGSRSEGMWVKVQGIECDGYYGVLLNEPNFLKNVCCGDVVVFRKEPHNPRPRFIRKRG